MNKNINILSTKDIENIHDKTLYLLEKYGINFEENRTIELFKKNGAVIDGSCVKFSPRLVEKCLNNTIQEFTVSARNPKKNVSIGKSHPPAIGPATGYVKVNSLNGGFRTANMQDYENFLKLSYLSKNINFTDIGMLYPDNPSETVDFCNMANKAIHLSDKVIFELSHNEDSARHIIKMAKIAVDRDCDHWTIGIANALSPLKWDAAMLGLIHAFAENKQPIVISVSSMAGFSSPLKLHKTLLLNNAEVLSGIIAARLINPDTPLVYANLSGAADFKSISLAYGSPELLLLGTAASQMANFYKLPFRGGGSTSDSKELDPQTGIEAAMNLTLSFMNNYDLIIQAIGGTESLMTLDYEKWILDEEIISRLKYRNNFKFRTITDKDVDNICSVSENGSFMTQNETILNFKNELFIPEMSDRTRRNTWEKLNISIVQKAEQIWKKKLEEFIPPVLDSSVSKAIQNYMKENFNL